MKVAQPACSLAGSRDEMYRDRGQCVAAAPTRTLALKYASNQGLQRHVLGGSRTYRLDIYPGGR